MGTGRAVSGRLWVWFANVALSARKPGIIGTSFRQIKSVFRRLRFFQFFRCLDYGRSGGLAAPGNGGVVGGDLRREASASAYFAHPADLDFGPPGDRTLPARRRSVVTL
jgi:hypothetical protein